jgi:hypothetical protein
MDEKSEDYAVMAAREWFLQTQTALHNNHLRYPEEDAMWVEQQAALDDAVVKLAAIIRKHVAPEGKPLWQGCHTCLHNHLDHW